MMTIWYESVIFFSFPDFAINLPYTATVWCSQEKVFFFKKNFHLRWKLQVLELGLNFMSAEDMSAILAVQLRKRLGFGITANMHVTGMHVEGKVKIFLFMAYLI